MIFPGKEVLIGRVVENSLNGRDENKGICCAGDPTVTTCMDSRAIIAGSFYTRSIVTGAVNTSSGSKTFAFYTYPPSLLPQNPVPLPSFSTNKTAPPPKFPVTRAPGIREKAYGAP